MASLVVRLSVFVAPWLLLSLAASLPTPPLQWLNLSGVLHGTAAPPPLKNAAIGYDESSRTLIIFGGESEGGFPQSHTYLLNLDTLTWSVPQPPTSLQQSPPARSEAVAGCDFAASNRHGFVVIGGKGADNQPLSDVWEYDFVNQFWSEVQISPGGPSARSSAVGGIDIRTPFIQDPVVPGPNNTFYLAGGFDGSSALPLSDFWRLNISGTLSSNLPDKARGSWEKLHFADLASLTQTGYSVLGLKVAVAGGCDQQGDCNVQNSFVIDSSDLQSISPQGCPTPRDGPVLTPNMNTLSDSFSSQVFMLLGTFNSSLWDDQGGLAQGEVDVLDINTGSWTRVLPSGDPGTNNKVTFPSPRSGSSAISSQLSLVGSSRTSSSDTIVFGGQDSSGNYLSEVWLLRAYSGVVSSSDPTWDGFGNGVLQTGTNATGTGVRMRYLTNCSVALHPSLTNNSSTSTSSTSSTSPDSTSSSSASPTVSTQLFDVSTSHKIASPLSVALLLPMILFFRLTSPSYNNSSDLSLIASLFAVAAFVAVFALGIIGLVTSFTTIQLVSSSILKRSVSSDLILRTSHGKAALAFSVGLYTLIAIFLISALAQFRRPASSSESSRSFGARTNSVDTAEKLRESGTAPTPRRRTSSWGYSSIFRLSQDGRKSSDTDSNVSSQPQTQRSFRVLNRPQRQPSDRRTMPSPSGHDGAPPITSRSLSDIDWLQRRRSLNAVGELDYAITQATRAQQEAWSPTTARAPSTAVQLPVTRPLPSTGHVIIRILFHVFLLGLCVISLMMLWSRAPRAAFAVFLVWTVAFYVILISLAWRGRPSHSVLSIMLYRLRGRHEVAVPKIISTPSSPSPQPVPFPSSSYPYLHQPSYQPVPAGLDTGVEGTPSPHDDDEEDDEDVRQRIIEDEMERREVSIVTVPKRRLWITNPS